MFNEYLIPTSKILKTDLLIGSLLITGGCASTIDAFSNRQVVEDQLITDDTGDQEIGTLAITAQRRLVVANLKTGHFCSEPPPESADTVISALSAALSANMKSNENVNAEFASNFARHVNQLYKRAHTVQLFRDAAFHLCVDAVNDSSFVGERPKNATYESYKEAIEGMVENLAPSLDKEVALYYATEQARAENLPSLYKETIICNSASSVGDSGDSSANKLSASITCQPLSGYIENKESKPNKQ